MESDDEKTPVACLDDDDGNKNFGGDAEKSFGGEVETVEDDNDVRGIGIGMGRCSGCGEEEFEMT